MDMHKNVYTCTFNLDHDIYEWTCRKMYIHLIWTMKSVNGTHTQTYTKQCTCTCVTVHMYMYTRILKISLCIYMYIVHVHIV